MLRFGVFLKFGAAPVALATAMLVPSAACAQSAPAQQADAPTPDESGSEIVVTGFRASLASALNQKRDETAAIDSILAEDIGKFPDSNLAESMQRVPGVALARGDGGEGKNISVRGLGAQFTRVRINGMEGTSQTAASDIYGSANAGRSFDFNVFPTEIFSALTVRKTPSADIEDGSLGATVDLTAPKPLAQKDDFVVSATVRGVWNELAKEVGPRASGLVSKQFGDGRFGILLSGAYQQRDIREVGYSAVDILSSDTNGGFCSPIGVTPLNPALNTVRGTTAANCSTNNPRTGSVAAYQIIQNARRASLPNTAGSGAFFPRIPRYSNSLQKQERYGGTLTLQFQPDDRTDISLDLLYSRFNVVRDDNYIEAISFGRAVTNGGQPMTSVRDVQLSNLGSVVYGLFDGVDVRSEGLHADFSTTFRQANLNLWRGLTDRLTVRAKFGMNESELYERRRLQYFMDAIDVDGFSIDYRDGGSTPLLNFGFDVSNPANFTYAPALADGTVLGGFSLQSKPNRQTTTGLTGEAEFDWKVSDAFTLKAGGQFRRSEYDALDSRIYTADTIVRALPAGTSLASLTTQITGLDQLWGRAAPASWATLDWRKLTDTFDLDSARRCGIECGAPAPRIVEDVTGAYVMGAFNLRDALGVPVRGDLGVRYVNTAQRSSGYISTSSATSPTGVAGRYAVVNRSYDDWLPSANVVIEPAESLLFRLSAAKVMSRPELGVLLPTSGVNPVTRSGTINNPFLEPIRANTFDAAVEWYFAPGSLLSAAFFYKDIKSFVQRLTENVPFTDLGLPTELLAGSNTLPSDLFLVSRPVNTPGGTLKGIEVNAQIPFTFLPGFLSNFGALANYTHVKSRVQYQLTPTTTTVADLIGLSRNTASGTLYYEDSKFSIRGTANYRDPFIRGIPASLGSDLQGNDSTIYVDASASYALTDQIRLIVEVQNLTDEQNRLYTDSVRQDTLFQTRVGRTVSVGANLRF